MPVLRDLKVHRPDPARRVTATELARNVGDVLGRVRYQGDSFLIERNGEVVARIVPARQEPRTLAELVRDWRAAGPPDADFADDLERINAMEYPPDESWPS